MKTYSLWLGALLFAMGLHTCYPQTPRWLKVESPWIYSGYMTAVARDSAGYLYAGTNTRGVLRSQDGGKSFTAANVGFGKLDIRSLVTTPAGNLMAATASGCYLSTDHGESWNLLQNGIRAEPITRLIVGRGGALYALRFYKEDFYRTNDWGLSWTTLKDSLSQNIISLAEGDNNLLFAGSWTARADRSTDGGRTWIQLPGFINGGFDPSDIALTPSGTLLVVLDGQYGSIQRSTDLGNTWLDPTRGEWRGEGNSRIFQPIARYIYIGTQSSGDLWLSTDDGDHWINLGGRYRGRVNDLTTDLMGRLLLATNNGLYRSSDLGNTWVQLDAGKQEQPVSLIETASGNRLFGRTTVGYFLSLDRGASWAGGVYPSPPIPSEIVEAPNGSLYAVVNQNFGDTGIGMLRYLDATGTWVTLLKIVPPMYATGRIYRAVFGPSGRIVCMTSDPLPYRSTNNGKTWTNFSCNDQSVWVFDMNSSGDMYGRVGTDLYRFADSTELWNKLTIPFSMSASAIVSVAPVTDDVFALTTDGVYRSTDGGNSWQHTSDVTASGIEFDILGQKAFLATPDLGVLSSDDRGETWAPMNDGLDSLRIVSIAFSPTDGLLYATTGASVYRTDRPAGTGTDPSSMSTPSLYQNYPNPFNPVTTIGYNLPRPSHVTLSVFNLLGQRVATLVEGEVEAGYHEVQFNATGLATGVYFYRLTVAEFAQTKKLLLVR